MALLEIKKFGCPTLRKKARPADAVTEEMRALVADMFETMYAAEGVGLAAPQVGVTQRVVVLDVGHHDPALGPLALVNPEVVWAEDEAVGEEGCLSLPGISGEVKRAARVRVRALDGDGTPVELTLSGIAARVTQHEIDHLDGILVIDRFGTIKRNLLRGQLRKLRREGSQQSPGLAYDRVEVRR